MAITTTRAERGDRWRMVRALAAAALTVSLLQITAPAVSLAQVATVAKKSAAKRPVHHRTTVKPTAKPATDTQASATDHQADELNRKWLSEYKANAAATSAAVTTTPSIAGTETERTLSAPTAVPTAAARAVVPGSITYVRADSAAAAFNSMPGGANQPLFKDLTQAFAGFSPSKAKVEMLQARTADGSSRVIYASIGEGKARHSFWWFAPPDEPEGWFDEHGKRLGGAALAEPKPGARISSPFGTRRYYGRITSHAFHNGIDFEGHTGDPIYAAADGVVNHADWYYNYGRTVKISHSGHFETLYAHMSRIAPGIVPGTVVHKGEVIGYVGATGRATGPHLHYEILVDGSQVNPGKVKMTASNKLTGKQLKAFQAQVAKIDARQSS